MVLRSPADEDYPRGTDARHRRIHSAGGPPDYLQIVAIAYADDVTRHRPAGARCPRGWPWRPSASRSLSPFPGRVRVWQSPRLQEGGPPPGRCPLLACVWKGRRLGLVRRYPQVQPVGCLSRSGVELFSESPSCGLTSWLFIVSELTSGPSGPVSCRVRASVRWRNCGPASQACPRWLLRSFEASLACLELFQVGVSLEGHA